MKYCEKCKVSINGERLNCPLCQQQLTGSADNSESAFPYVPSIQKQFGTWFKLAVLIGIACAILSVAINFAIPQGGFWSAFVVGGIVCLFVSVGFAINKWSNPAKNIIYQVAIVSGSTCVWDYFTGWRGWSISYVVPIICVSAMVTMAVISRILKLHLQDSMLYWIIGILYGLVPIIFLFTCKLLTIYPTLICVSISLIMLAAFILFEGKHIVAELKKRFHL